MLLTLLVVACAVRRPVRLPRPVCVPGPLLLPTMRALQDHGLNGIPQALSFDVGYAPSPVQKVADAVGVGKAL